MAFRIEERVLRAAYIYRHIAFIISGLWVARRSGCGTGEARGGEIIDCDKCIDDDWFLSVLVLICSMKDDRDWSPIEYCISESRCVRVHCSLSMQIVESRCCTGQSDDALTRPRALLTKS